MAPMSLIREKRQLHQKVISITSRKVTSRARVISPVRVVISPARVATSVRAISPVRVVISVKVVTSPARVAISPVKAATSPATSSHRQPVSNKILMPKARQ